MNIIQKDFERGWGAVEMHLMWAEGGQELGIGSTGAFK